MDSVESEEVSQEQEAAEVPRVAVVKRAMAEDKLQEKRLKERARRNGMASSIDEMRLLVPELIEAKKNYSQAKVVAFALAHIYELQRENDAFRERLGLPSRMEEFRARAKTTGKTKKERAPAGERGRKRRRLNTDLPAPAAISTPTVAAVTGATTAPAVALPAAPTPSQSLLSATPASAPSPSFLATAVSSVAEPRRYGTAISPSTSIVSAASPRSLTSSGAHPEDDLELDMDMDSFVVDSLAASPALSPHAIDDELGPFASNFDNFNNFDTHPRPHAMEWDANDADMPDMFQASAAADFGSAPSKQFESFFVDHVLNHTASLQ